MNTTLIKTKQSVTATTSVQLRAIGCDHRVTVAGTVDAEQVRTRLSQRLDELDLAVSRFRADSELSRFNQLSREAYADGLLSVRVPVSRVFEQAMQAALRAADLTGGLVAPNLAAQVAAAGYDADFEVVRRRGNIGRSSEPLRPATTGALPQVDTVRHEIVASAGTQLDLGAGAKAWCADELAAELADDLALGVLVSLGGDVATAGPLPDDGWVVDVEDWNGAVVQQISVTQAVTTSSTMVRRWTRHGRPQHHIIDPRTGRPASTPWGQVSAAAPDAVQANAATTAAVVLGDAAPAWLEERGVPARLQARDGRCVVTRGWAGAR